MTDALSLIGIGISAFVATNIDDLFVLMFFFSNHNFGKLQVTLGQYRGISLLVIVSTLGALISLVIPQSLIGLLGLVPITTGIIRLVRPDKEKNSVYGTRQKYWQMESSICAYCCSSNIVKRRRQHRNLHSTIC